MAELSVLIPNRNSPFLTKTIKDLLQKAVGDIEVIVNVDEQWPEEIVDDKRVIYLHPAQPIGLRQGINACARVARGKYLMKLDDHCMVAPGFDKVLIENHLSNNWVQIPRRYALDAEKWAIEERTDNKYPIDYMYQDFPRKGKANDDGTHGVEWRERRDERTDSKYDIDDTPSFQGSCWFMTKDYFDNFLHGLHEEGYGQFAQEAQEIGFKTWLGGGAVRVNKKTWYAHLHKGKVYGRFYKMPSGNPESDSWSASHWLNNEEPGMIKKFAWLIDNKFPGMPGWPIDWKEQIKEMGWVK
jgi:glycosyltransferase involved in cell wall biosynthesis